MGNRFRRIHKEIRIATMSTDESTVTDLAASLKKITLKTADDELFHVEESVAMELATVKNFYEESTSTSDDSAVVPLPNVSAKTLARIIVYCTKQVEFRHRAAEDGEKKKYGQDFVRELSYEELRDLISATNYLNVPYLLDILNQDAADRIKNKSVEFVREFFGIQNDFTPEEEQAIRDQYPWAYEGVDED